MQKCENLVDLEKRCKMSIWSQKSALIQLRTDRLKLLGADPRAAAAEIAKLKAEVARLKGSSRAPPPNRPAPNVAPRGPATLATVSYTHLTLPTKA